MSGTAGVLLAITAMTGCASSAEDGSSAASCAGPELEVSAAGGTLTISGRYFTDGCADAADQNGPIETETPMSAVPLTLTDSDGTVHQLGPLPATGTLGRIEATVTLPDDVTAGEATVTLGTAEPVTVSITS